MSFHVLEENLLCGRSVANFSYEKYFVKMIKLHKDFILLILIGYRFMQTVTNLMKFC